MRKRLAAICATVLVWSSATVTGQAPLYHALAGNDAYEPAFRVHVRDASSGELADSTIGSRAGRFSFDSLRSGTYVVEIADAAGTPVGLSSSMAVTTGSTLTVTVGVLAARALAGSRGKGGSLHDIGPLALVSVVRAAGAQSRAAVLAMREGKLLVCHASGGVRRTLEIRDAAREAHMTHGDALGACPQAP